jgi:hypothetical protein
VACFAHRGFADWLPYDKKLATAVKVAGGEAMYSLGVTWLAATQPPDPVTSPMPPEPTPAAPPAADDLTVEVKVTRGGTPVPFVVKAGAVAMLVLMGTSAVALTRPSLPPPSAAVAAAPLPPRLDQRNFRFAGAPGGRLITECLRNDGVWQNCLDH